MTEYKVRHIIPDGISTITFHADTYEIDDGLLKFDDEDGNDVYLCSMKNLIDIVPTELDEDDEDDEDEKYEGHNINSHHLLVENITTVLPQEHK